MSEVKIQPHIRGKTELKNIYFQIICVRSKTVLIYLLHPGDPFLSVDIFRTFVHISHTIRTTCDISKYSSRPGKVNQVNYTANNNLILIQFYTQTSKSASSEAN